VLFRRLARDARKAWLAAVNPPSWHDLCAALIAWRQIMRRRWVLLAVLVALVVILLVRRYRSPPPLNVTPEARKEIDKAKRR
jgi:hypothetical protein